MIVCENRINHEEHEVHTKSTKGYYYSPCVFMFSPLCKLFLAKTLRRKENHIYCDIYLREYDTLDCHYAFAPLCLCTIVPLRHCTFTPLSRCAFAPLCLCAFVPLRLCTFVPLRHLSLYCSIYKKKEGILLRYPLILKSATSYSPTCAVPSALSGLTSLFGMGRGGTPML
jgi:hypothetical protein